MSQTPRNIPPASFDMDPSRNENWFAADTNVVPRGDVVDPRTADGFVVDPDKLLSDMAHPSSSRTSPSQSAPERDYPENWLEEALKKGGQYSAHQHATPRNKRVEPTDLSPEVVKGTTGKGRSRAGSDQ